MILIDSDVLLDVVLRREPHIGPSLTFLTQTREADELASVAWHSIANVYYVADRHHVDARDFLLRLLDWVDIAPTDADSVRYAAALPMADFEDALQVAAARACDARHIVTRNLADFAGSPIPAISPREALRSLS